MRLLLACILALLSLTAWDGTSAASNPGELDPHSASNPPALDEAKTADITDNGIQQLGLFDNPYSPTSHTNFEAFTTTSQHDPGRMRPHTYEPEWLNDPFGRYGSPYSPDPMNQRYDVGNLYSPGGPMNLYMRGGRMERR